MEWRMGHRRNLAPGCSEIATSSFSAPNKEKTPIDGPNLVAALGSYHMGARRVQELEMGTPANTGPYIESKSGGHPPPCNFSPFNGRIGAIPPFSEIAWKKRDEIGPSLGGSGALELSRPSG